MISAFTLVIVVAVSLMAFEVGIQSVHRFEAHDAAESLAYANALQIISNPAPGYNGQVTSSEVMLTNTQTTDSPQVTLNQVYSQTTGTAACDLPYSPTFPPSWQQSGGATVKVQGTTNSLFAGASLGFINNINSPPTQGAVATTAVNQLQWTSLRPVPARVMLLMDFSRSMRLQYATCPPATPGCASINVMRSDAVEIVNALTLSPAGTSLGLANFGTMPFWENPADDATGLVAPLTYPSDLDPVAIQVHNQQIALGVNTTSTQGSGTNIARAISAATSMLTASPTDPTQGPGVIVIISDGEPDDCTSQSNYQDNVTCAINEAEAAVQSAWAQGIITYGVLIDRDLAETDLSNSELQGFFQSISGGTGIPSEPCSFNGAALAGSYCTIAQTPGDVVAWLNTSLTPQTLPIHCLAQNITVPTTAWMRAPMATDNIYSYIIPAARMPNNELPLTRFPLSQRAALDSGAYNSNPAFLYNPAPVANGVPLPFPLIEVNHAACIYQITAQIAGTQQPNFRMRWGEPVLAQTLGITNGTTF